RSPGFRVGAERREQRRADGEPFGADQYVHSRPFVQVAEQLRLQLDLALHAVHRLQHQVAVATAPRVLEHGEGRGVDRLELLQYVERLALRLCRLRRADVRGQVVVEVAAHGAPGQAVAPRYDPQGGERYQRAVNRPALGMAAHRTSARHQCLALAPAG